MKILNYLFYNYVVLPLLYLFFQLLQIFNKKVKSAISDRKLLFLTLPDKINNLKQGNKIIWFHSSSMGEFEQAKPIIEKLKQNDKISIFVSFFSPSGYNNSLKYSFADAISYIPFDTVWNMKRFINMVKPDLAIFMRYDIWPNTIWELKKNNIPSFIVDATMRADSKRKLPFSKGFHVDLYSAITLILTVSEADKKNFEDFEISSQKVTAVGDTRFDRVYQKSLQAKDKKLFWDGMFANKKVVVLGSSWEADEEVIIPAFLKLCKYDKDVILIIVPHEPTIEHLERTESVLGNQVKHIRFSYLNNYTDEQIIIIDSIGILLTLYFYADIAYVGGSFKQGIHNVLEPAVYGIPVMFGPKIQTSQEAQILVQKGAGILVRDKMEAYKALRKLLTDKTYCESLGKIAGRYVSSNIGATDKIIHEVYKVLDK
ncbi:MAG: glycosyltransferase N-terminal domain-containing protein [bacterium]